MAGTIHLNPSAPIAERVLLPGDPQRALHVAQALLAEPRMLNARRGLWGYTGTAPDGGVVTIQSTGMGGPSAAIVVEELIDHGARTLIRIGTCGALVPELALGELLAVEAAIGADGASQGLGSGGPDADLTAALLHAGARGATVVTTDLFYDPREELPDRWRAAGAQAIEMETAAIFAVARRRGVSAASLLAVTDQLANGRVRMEQETIEEVGLELGRTALRALEAV
ncbi:MAG: purine-nucleoside phosphorylase [Thermoleophilaceae bacterium]|nr:purine-nucleoside phosphorylase [Thermoleophilaceae bacterium]